MILTVTKTIYWTSFAEVTLVFLFDDVLLLLRETSRICDITTLENVCLMLNFENFSAVKTGRKNVEATQSQRNYLYTLYKSLNYFST